MMSDSTKHLIRIPRPKRLKTLADEPLQALAEESGAQRGTLSLGASQTIGQYLLPNLMAGFLREHPRVELTAISGNTEEVLEALTTHAIEIALIEGPAKRRDIVVEPFLEDYMVLAAPTGHKWAAKEISIETLAAEPFLMR